jgi:hypothetical protein
MENFQKDHQDGVLLLLAVVDARHTAREVDQSRRIPEPELSGVVGVVDLVTFDKKLPIVNSIRAVNVHSLRRRSGQIRQKVTDCKYVVSEL